MKVTPVVDIFAGAGGLGEGFGSCNSSNHSFDIRLSIEMDAKACDTLRLRAFFRQFSPGMAPELYYQAVRGDTYALERIKLTSAWKESLGKVQNWTLGKTDPELVHKAIATAVGGNRDWVLLGGPPCQAYSVIGRAVMTGTGSRFSDEVARAKHRKQLEESFAEDHRHTLYRQYLEIVGVHQPAVFIMENVTGILSARVPVGRDREGDLLYEPVLKHIMSDLRDPATALRKGRPIGALQKLYRSKPKVRYRLLSFTSPSGPTGECDEVSDFLISCEKFGVPQSRRRMIILGVREDFDTTELNLLNHWKTEVPAAAMLNGLPRIRSSLSADSKTRGRYGHDSQESWFKALRESLPASAIAKMDDKARKVVRAILDRGTTRLSRGSNFIEADVKPTEAPAKLRSWIHDDRVGGAVQHDARSHMASDLGRYLYAAAAALKADISPKMEEWPQELLPEHQSVRVSRNQKTTIVDGFNDRFRVQVLSKPSTTIVSHISKDGHSIIHPDPEQCRSLTVREVARLQTFPDNYFFCGTRTEQYTQIGNAVPPLLAFQLATIVATLLEVNAVRVKPKPRASAA